MAKGMVFVMCAVVPAVLVFSGCAATGETKVAKFVLRVDCTATEPYTDKAGNVWLMDQFFEEGKKWGGRWWDDRGPRRPRR